MSVTEDGAALLAKIKPQLREKAAHICMVPELIDEWEDANAKLTEMQANESTAAAATGTAAARGAARKASKAALEKQAQKVQDLEDKIDAADMRFVIRALPKDRYQALCEENPPRKGDQIDEFAGYNRLAVSDLSVRLGLVSPVFADCMTKDCVHEDCGTWQAFLRVCSAGEWAVLRDTADEANGAVTQAPKSLLASRILGKAESTSRQPAAGE